MFKLMDKKIITLLRWHFLLNWPYMYPKYLDIHISYFVHPEILTCPKSNSKLIISFFGQQLNPVGPDTRKSLHKSVIISLWDSLTLHSIGYF